MPSILRATTEWYQAHKHLMKIAEEYEKGCVNFGEGVIEIVMKPALKKAFQLIFEGWLNVGKCRGFLWFCAAEK